MATSEFDTVVIGAGAVGSAVAYGLCRAGERVCLLDEGDIAYRASRGNFGLVWVQGKGVGNPDYARWTRASATRWPTFAGELATVTGVDVALSQTGGFAICVNEQELQAKADAFESIRRDMGGDYPYEVLTTAQLRAQIPAAGSAVAGALFCPMDGHVSPLKLLRALFDAVQRRGGQLRTGQGVKGIEPQPAGGFLIHAGTGKLASAKVVLAAGLGNRDLAPQVGLYAPVKPIRGQLLVTERLQPFLRHPTTNVRQTDEGSVQIGPSYEEVGFDDHTTLAELSRMAARALRCFPCLSTANIVRTWGALRVMSPDNFPIYQASSQHPGAFVVTCHSGITLAAQHAGPIAEWIHGGPAPAEIAKFSSERFHVQKD